MEVVNLEVVRLAHEGLHLLDFVEKRMAFQVCQRQLMQLHSSSSKLHRAIILADIEDDHTVAVEYFQVQARQEMVDLATPRVGDVVVQECRMASVASLAVRRTLAMRGNEAKANSGGVNVAHVQSEVWQAQVARSPCQHSWPADEEAVVILAGTRELKVLEFTSKLRKEPFSIVSDLDRF